MKDKLAFLMMFRKPAGFLPVAMSLTAFAVVLGCLALFGVTHQPDEGAAAHVWQILMAGQVPLVGYFMIRWLPRAPLPALLVLSGQATPALIAVAPVWLLHL